MNGDCVLLGPSSLPDVVDDDRITDVFTELANREDGDAHVTIVLARYQSPTS